MNTLTCTVRNVLQNLPVNNRKKKNIYHNAIFVLYVVFNLEPQSGEDKKTMDAMDHVFCC